MGSANESVHQLLEEFQEFDSVFHIVEKCQCDFLRDGFYSNRNGIRPVICCMDSCNEYVVFGWDNGFLSLVDKKLSRVVETVQVGNVRKLLRRNSPFVPISLRMRTESRLIIICSCWDAKKMAVKKYSTGRDYEQSLAVFHSSHLSDNRKIKLYPISVQNPHHNMLSGNIYVSSSGKEFITGDVRGLIVFYKYTDETTSYKSSVLTVVPGSIVDLKLSEGYLLLITCCLPSEVSLSSTIAHDILEVVHSYALTYYLFNMNTRKLIKLDLNNLLPSSLGLNISCVSPVWLYDSDLHFACTLSYISTLPSSNPLPNETNNSDTFYLCAIFSINKGDREDNIQVDLHSLMPVEKTSFINQSNRLRVLPSQISVDLAYTTIDRADNNELEWNQFKSCMLNAASGLHALSSDVLVFWSRSTNHKQSLFALLQPSLCTRKALLTTLNTKLPLIKSLNVLTYSQQLGEICTISPLWLKPCHNYAARSRAFGGIGLEVWIVRRLPQGYELNNSEVIVLSTRPLRAHLVALAPNVTYTDFANANRSALIRSVIQQKITTTSIKHPINDMLQATRSHPSLLTASSFCSSSSSSSLSSKASIQSQRLCSNSVTVYDHQRSRLSFSSGKYQSEIFKMSVFVPWPTIPLRVGNMHKLNIFKVSSDVIDGYDIGVDACTLLGDECESSSYLSSKVNDLTNSTSDLFLTSKSQLQSALSAPSADTYASSEVNVVIQSSDDTSWSKTDNSRHDSSSTNVIYQSEFSEVSKILNIDSCSSSNLEEIDYIEEKFDEENEVAISTNREVTCSTKGNNGDNADVQLCQSVEANSTFITINNMGNGLNTDGNRLVSHGSNSPNNKNVCTLHASSAWSFDFCLSTMITPSAGDGQTSSLSENDLTTDCFDLLPFVEFTGRPGIALHDSVNRKNLKTILAPLQFDNVYSIHVSPDGKLIWCLVPPRNLSTNNHQNNLATNNVSNNDNCKSFSVDVCLESGGLKSLLKAWDSNEIGQWEFNVLLQITSVDLSNTYAVFSTSSGHLKIQTGLSSKRPYNQSYTWPCPGYHILQVATCLSGLVWCLAIKQLNDETESLPSNDDGFVLLSSTLPVSITHRNTFPQVKSVSNTTTTTSVVDQLKQLKWSTCFTLPSLLSRSLFERFISAGNLLTLSDLTSAVNFELQIVLISQKEKMSMDKKDNNSLIDCKYHSITGWILVTYHSQESKAYNNSNIHSSKGFIQMIIETEGDYELVTDWNQFTISEISCSGSAMNKSGFSDFIMKHISPKPKDLITYSVPLIRYTHSIIKNKDHINDDNESKPNQLIFNQPMRITLQQSWNKTTVVMQPIKSSSCLSTYQWQQHHYVLPEFGNANNLLIMHTFSTLNRNSNNNNNNVFIKSLWIPDRRSLTNRGIKCYAETQVKSVIDLFIPYPNENDQNEKLTVSAMCTLANELLSSGDYPLQLFIAFTNGLFMSRIGVSNQNPIGTRWLTLSCPDLWKNKDLNTNPTVITYFTSLSCIKMKLWATDSQGRLFSSKLLLNNNTTNKDDSYWEALTWNLDSTSDNDPSSQLQSIYFTSINGASWEFYGLGTCLWSIGGICCPLQKSNIDNNPFEFLTNIRYEFQKQISMNSINHQSVYVRCFKEDCNPDKCFYWLHVPSPPCKSIHVSNNGVWLLSSTYPSQIYYRIGLPMNQYDNNNSNINYTDPLPAPKNYHIGYAWQSIASPSVFDYHSLNLAAIYIPFSTDFIIQFKNSDVFSANSSSSKQSTSIPACYSLKSYHYPIILYALTDTGLFLSLSSGPIVKFNAYCNSSIDENVESTQLLLSTCNIHDSEHNELIIIGSKSNSLTS